MVVGLLERMAHHCRLWEAHGPPVRDSRGAWPTGASGPTAMAHHCRPYEAHGPPVRPARQPWPILPALRSAWPITAGSGRRMAHRCVIQEAHGPPVRPARQPWPITAGVEECINRRGDGGRREAEPAYPRATSEAWSSVGSSPSTVAMTDISVRVARPPITVAKDVSAASRPVAIRTSDCRGASRVAS